MLWHEILCPCANDGCANMVMVRQYLNDRGVWVEDENTCCCSMECYEAHLKEIEKKLRERPETD